MIDFFYEESSTYSSNHGSNTKSKIFSFVSWLFYLISAIWALFAIIMLINKKYLLISLIFCTLIFLIFFGTGLFFRKAKERLFVDYDYTILSGTVAFSKIVGNDKRRNIIKIDISSIERIGKPGSSAYNKFASMPEIIIKNLTANKEPTENKQFYYLFFNAEGNKHLYVIECTKLFISNLVRFTRSIVLDGDVK